MSDPVKCVCGGAPIYHDQTPRYPELGIRWFACQSCGRSSAPGRTHDEALEKWNSDIRAIKHHGAAVEALKEIRAQTVNHAQMMQAEDMGDIYREADEALKEMEE